MGEPMRSERCRNVTLAAIITLAAALAMPAMAKDGITASPALSEELVPLEFMMGNWKVTEILDSGPMGRSGKGAGEMVARMGPGGRSILLDYRSVEEPMAGFSMHEIFTFDPGEGVFLQVYVTNRSSGLETANGKTSDEGFVFERRVERNEQTYISRGTIQEISDDSFAMESFFGPADDETTRVMRLEYSRP